jgi:hypothetical protein
MGEKVTSLRGSDSTLRRLVLLDADVADAMGANVGQ